MKALSSRLPMETAVVKAESLLIILIAAWIISGIFSRLIRHAMQRVSGTSQLLENFLVKVARWLILAIGIIMALSALEISVGPLLAVVGAAGFAIAFALQDSLSNFANGCLKNAPHDDVTWR